MLLDLTIDHQTPAFLLGTETPASKACLGLRLSIYQLRLGSVIKRIGYQQRKQQRMTEEKCPPSFYLLCPQGSEARQEGGDVVGGRQHPLPFLCPSISFIRSHRNQQLGLLCREEEIREWIRLKYCNGLKSFYYEKYSNICKSRM